MSSNNIVVVGSGIVGLASALKILESQPGTKVFILEKETEAARHQTGHNSGVIHSGVYYRPGSLKAKNCVKGYQQLLNFCETEAVPFEICGKIIAATTEAEVKILQDILERGRSNGLKGLDLLSPEETKEKEPHVECLQSLFVPQAGIIDYKLVSKAYIKKIRELGGEIRFGQRVIDIVEETNGAKVITESKEYSCRHAVNCGGLFSDRLAKKVNQHIDIRIIPFRGEYYVLKKEKHHLVNHLVYPVPDPRFPFLGVHFTRMIKGGIEAGPNAVLALKREGYTWSDIDLGDIKDTFTWPGFYKMAFKYLGVGIGETYRSFSKSAFTRSLQKLIPSIKEEDLEEGGSGVRAQACARTGKLIDDFMIIENPKVTHVCNAPSPAATSSLAIGEYVSQIVNRRT